MLVDGFTDTAVGPLPTFILAITLLLLPSITDTVLSPLLAT